MYFTSVSVIIWALNDIHICLASPKFCAPYFLFKSLACSYALNHPLTSESGVTEETSVKLVAIGLTQLIDTRHVTAYVRTIESTYLIPGFSHDLLFVFLDQH